MTRLLTLLILASPIAAWTSEPKNILGVDWAAQRLKASGSGPPDLSVRNLAQARLGAERAALTDALRNLLAQVKGLQVATDKKMDDVMKDEKTRARVEALLHGYKVVSKRYFSDGGIELELEVPLSLLTEVFDPEPAPQLEGLKMEGEKTNTGLVIDARGLKVLPALAPRVLDSSGKSVYSVDVLSEDARKISGVAAYTQSLEEAKKSLKAGDKPLVVKAIKANGTDLVLSPADGSKLAAINAFFLTEGRVVIVTGAP